jgi:hypothetical protein
LPLKVGLTQTISFLLETRGIGLGPQHFLRRTATMRTMLSSIVDSAVAQAETVFDTVERGRQRWIEGREEVVIRDSSILGTRDVRLCSPAQGRCATRQVEWHSYVVMLPSAVAVYTGADAYLATMPLRARTTPTVPALTRARPSAYIIPRGWADVAERLRGLGLQVETIENPFEGEVETLKVESVSFGQTYYEGASILKLGNDPRRKPDTTHPACPHHTLPGAVHVAIATSPQVQTVKLPAKSFRVPSAQQNFALAVAALEVCLQARCSPFP